MVACTGGCRNTPSSHMSASRDEARKKFREAEQKFYIDLALLLPLVNIYINNEIHKIYLKNKVFSPLYLINLCLKLRGH